VEAKRSFSRGCSGEANDSEGLWKPFIKSSNRRKTMSTLLIIIILLLLFGGGGGFYAYNTYGGTGLGGVLGTVLVIFLILWLLGMVR
jgi:Protein of unknown function (DUF3309)